MDRFRFLTDRAAIWRCCTSSPNREPGRNTASTSITTTQISSGDAHDLVPTAKSNSSAAITSRPMGTGRAATTGSISARPSTRYNAKLAVHPDSGINSLADLRGKVVGTRGNHPGLNDWLSLKQHGLDVDRDDVELVKSTTAKSRPKGRTGGGKAGDKKPSAAAVAWVRDRKVDAALLTPPRACSPKPPA